MKKLVLALAILAMALFAQDMTAQEHTNRVGLSVPHGLKPSASNDNGYVSLRQSVTGSDVLPPATEGVDTLEYAAGELSLVHNLGAPIPLATTQSTVASALSLAAVPTACPAGEAVNSIDAKGNAMVCIPMPAPYIPPVVPVTASEPGSTFLYTYTQPAIQEGDTLTGDVKLFASHATIPANVLAVGSYIELEASGTYNIATAQEANAGQVWIQFAGNRVASSNFNTNLVMGTNYLWTAHFKAIIRSTGPSGALDPLLTVSSSLNQWGGFRELAGFSPATTIDTTNAASIQIEFDKGFSGDSATLRQMTVTVR